MIYYNKKMNMVFFDVNTLREIFEKPSREVLLKKIFELNLDQIDKLIFDPKERQIISDDVSLINNKEEIEIFIAIYSIIKFFKDTEKISFFMKDGFDPKRDAVNSLESLKKNIREYHPADFGLLKGRELRLIQLKSYRGKCEIKDFSSFLEKKLKHYAFDLGSINLYITLQSGGVIEKDFFHNTHDYLKTLGIKGTGEILITYNENGKFEVLNIVHPELSTMRLPFKPISSNL